MASTSAENTGTASLSALLAGGRGVVLDGALATYLEAMGEGTSPAMSHDHPST